MNEVLGKVEAKGDKFNGSVKVNGQWYNFKKGVDHSAVKVGNEVKLELSEWEFKGKTGVSVSNFTVTGDTVTTSSPSALTQIKGRDYEAEARGKTRCSLFAAALASPALGQYASSVETLIDLAKAVADAGVKYTFGD